MSTSFVQINMNMPKIYESPDGGNTVYEREIGDDVLNRKLMSVAKTKPGFNEYGEIWNEVSGFPDWRLIRKYKDLRVTYEKYLAMQEHYKVLDVLSEDETD